MKLLADIHTHSIASGHAYSTITENILAAKEMGLQMIALTDHAPEMQGTTRHAYFMNLQVIPDTLHGVRVLRGVELNIMDFDGTVDLDDYALSRLDIAIASLHPPCIAPGSRKENTNAYLRVMDHPYIDIIGHPGDPRYDVDYKEVIRYAIKTNTLLEINNASLMPDGFRAGSSENIEWILNMAKEEGMPIVVGSDAHYFTGVGAFPYVERLLEKVRFPQELILNLDPERLLQSLKSRAGEN